MSTFKASSTLKLSSKSTMAVMTTSPTTTEIKGQQIVTKKHSKTLDKPRPITATLDHPLILDIKLLKKLDMTTFTKKGLIALSKFCGISLINKTESKRKLNKCLKTIQYSKKQSEGGIIVKSLEPRKDCLKAKRKGSKQGTKINPRIRFKLTDDISCSEEDSSDVVCKRHNKINKQPERKSVIDDMFSGSTHNIVPEPCKTCSRSEHPERFHSHPKTKIPEKRKPSGKTNLEERFKNSVTTKDSAESLGRERKSPDAKSSNRSPQKSPSSEEKSSKSVISKPKAVHSPTKSCSSLSSPEPRIVKTRNKKPVVSSPEKKSDSDVVYLKKISTRSSMSQKEEKLSQSTSADDAMQFVTGCYVCGKPISPKLRIKHEESCILEWRAQNDALSPEKRMPEPIRPDYRFTASGDLDPQGTFESIWANHKDSLVPCKKCGRKFFPDRIERHENCCNNLPVNFKYKHV